MRITILSPADLSYNSGSIIFTKNLFRFLHNKGYETYLLGNRLPNDIKQKYYRYIKISKKLLDHPIIDDRNVSDIEIIDSLMRSTKYLLQVNKKHKVDLFFGMYGSFTSLACYIASSLTKIPYIVSSFGRDFYQGILKDERFKWMALESFMNAYKIIVPQKSLIQEFTNYEKKLDKGKFEIIGMPIDNSIFEKGKVSFNSKSKYICTVNSCFSPEKGIDQIIKAYSVNNKLKNYKLLIAGQDDHPERIHKKRILDKIKSLGLSKKVLLVGFLGRKNIGNLIREAEFLIDNRLTNNFSSVIVEALSLGTPVVCSKNSFSNEIIRNGLNGYLYSSGDIVEMNTKINCLIERYSKIKSTNRNEKYLIRKKYSETYCFEKYLNTFKEIARGPIC